MVNAILLCPSFPMSVIGNPSGLFGEGALLTTGGDDSAGDKANLYLRRSR